MQRGRAGALRASTVAGLVALGAWSCASVAPATKAAEVEHLQCDASTGDDADLRVIDGMTVLAVHPVYSYVHTATTGTDKVVIGAELLIRPPEAIDTQRVLRILQCHGARAVLGKRDLSKFPDDPFWLDGAWVEIQLEPEAGNLGLTVQTDGVQKNLEVLARARAFATTHRSSAFVPAPG
jgi:hypothetical protein